MAERVIVRQDSQFQTMVYTQDVHEAEHGHAEAHFYPVADVRQLTPYGMMLAGLASCTTIVILTYAQHRQLPVEEVEIHLSYDRVFADDCENCEQINRYEELIEEQIILRGDLTPEQRKRLFAVSKQCPIHKMLAHGIEIKSQLGGEL
jgi:putative redox protein